MPVTSYHPSELMHVMRSAAAVEERIGGEAWLRRYHFDPGWSKGMAMAKFDNGAGDFVYILWGDFGCVVIGFDHESPVSPHAQDEYGLWPGLLDGIPSEVLEIVKDPAIDAEEGMTFIHWNAGDCWNQGPVAFPNGEDDGSGWLLGMIQFTQTEFIELAKTYWGDKFHAVGKEGIDECFR